MRIVCSKSGAVDGNPRINRSFQFFGYGCLALHSLWMFILTWSSDGAKKAKNCHREREPIPRVRPRAHEVKYQCPKVSYSRQHVLYSISYPKSSWGVKRREHFELRQFRVIYSWYVLPFIAIRCRYDICQRKTITLLVLVSGASHNVCRVWLSGAS